MLITMSYAIISGVHSTLVTSLFLPFFPVDQLQKLALLVLLSRGFDRTCLVVLRLPLVLIKRPYPPRCVWW